METMTVQVRSIAPTCYCHIAARETVPIKSHKLDILSSILSAATIHFAGQHGCAGGTYNAARSARLAETAVFESLALYHQCLRS